MSSVTKIIYLYGKKFLLKTKKSLRQKSLGFFHLTMRKNFYRMILRGDLMKIYLDNCCYNRPFDDQKQIKIQLETIAKLHIQNQIKIGIYNLVWSYILDFENKNNPYEDKKFQIAEWRFIAKENIFEENEEIILTAEKLQAEKNIKTYDALHIACAIFAKCDYFITVDKKLLNTQIEEIKIISPINFLQEVE